MANMLEGLFARVGLIGVVLVYFWQRKLLWLIPVLILLLVIGTLMAFAEASGVAPFIYTLF
jgi:hypothetical protein